MQLEATLSNLPRELNGPAGPTWPSALISTWVRISWPLALTGKQVGTVKAGATAVLCEAAEGLGSKERGLSVKVRISSRQYNPISVEAKGYREDKTRLRAGRRTRRSRARFC